MLALLSASAAGYTLTVAPPLPAARTRAVRMSFDDESLMASLRARMATAETDTAAGGELLPVLSIEDMGADAMGPRDVLEYAMKAFAIDCDEGCRVLMGCAPKGGEKEDSLGQVQPGAFADPRSLADFFGGHERYKMLLSVSEWKCMDLTMSNLSRNVASKLLIRRDGANWEDLFVNMQLVDTEVVGKRWLITSVYKQQKSA